MSKSRENTPSIASLREQAVRGSLWTIIGNAGCQSLTLIASVVLARLLSPEEFGLFGICAILLAVARIVLPLGLGSFVVQRKLQHPSILGTVFTFQVGAGIVAATVSLAVSPWIAHIFHDARLVPLLRWTSPSLALLALTVTPRAMQQRELHFRPAAIISTIAVVVQGVVSCGLAALGHGPLSLVLGVVAADAVTAILFLSQAKGLRLMIDTGYLREIFGYSWQMLLTVVLGNCVNPIGDTLIGRYLTKTDLGLYGRTYGLVMMPLKQVAANVYQVLFPLLSKTQGNRALTKGAFLQTLSLVSVAIVPLMTGLVLTADHFVLTVYGEKWQAMIPLLRIMALTAILQCLNAATSPLFVATNAIRARMQFAAINLVVTTAGFVIGISSGSLTGFCWSYLGATVVMHIPLFMIGGRLINLSYWTVLRSLSGIFICSLLMAILVWSLKQYLPDAWPHPVSLVILSMAGGVSYLALLHVSGVTAYAQAVRLVRSYFVKEPRPCEP